MSLSKCAVTLITSLLVQHCCYIIIFNIQLALYLPVGWDNLRCSIRVFLALTSKVKKMKSLKQWSQIPIWYCAGNARVAFHLGRASVEYVCRAPGASQTGCWTLHCSRTFTLAMNKCVAMSRIHWLQNTWLLREKLCCNYLCFLQVLLLGIDDLIELLIY